MPDPLARIPSRIVGGTTVDWYLAESDYLAPAWAATVDFVATGDQQQFAAADNGDGRHLFTILGSESDDFLPAVSPYSYQIKVTKGAEVRLVDSGTVEIVTDFSAQGSGFDARTFAAKALDALEARIEGKATKDQLAFTIAGRSVSRYGWDEILSARDKFRTEVAREKRRERISRGLEPAGLVKTRFVR